MYDFSLQLLLAVFAVFILACVGYGILRLRALRADAAEEYVDRAATKPATVRGVNEAEFVRLYVKSFAPRWAFYLAAGCAIAIGLSPVALVLIPVGYEQIWLASGAADWAGRGGYVFMEFYTSPSDEDEWGSDLLGSTVLGAGESAEVTIADGSDQCVYDFRFVFEDGDVVEDFGIDICELAEYTLSE